MTDIYAWGLGTCNESASGVMLDCFFPAPVIRPDAQAADAISATFGAGASRVDAKALSARLAGLPAQLADRLAPLAESTRPLVSVVLAEDGPITSTADAYLKLHLLSHRLAKPNSQNLDGIFAHLPNVAWTTAGPILAEELPEALMRARVRGQHLEVQSLDKFPRMVNYVVPPGVRIADASRVRLGAYLGDGTTVMHEGQINFNSGTLGQAMVEGRISQGVVLGAHSDLGGGASTMGTLSGGNSVVISIGESCLIGANAGCGIPLGDRCTIEAGLYITAATPVLVIDEHGTEVRRVKARELAGGSDMLFIRNGATGQVQCRTNRRAIELNEALHAHN